MPEGAAEPGDASSRSGNAATGEAQHRNVGGLTIPHRQLGRYELHCARTHAARTARRAAGRWPLR